jgi:signal transduction histidine kinase/ligand-binding sensor domain-containing protein
LLLVTAGSVQALDPNKLITQYGHTAWRVQDGYLTYPAGITQTTDGYIWIGTREGLLRFDGAKFTIWTPPAGQYLPGRGFSALLGTRDGSLWIGTPGGLSQLKDGQLINYAPPQGSGGVYAIIEDEAGGVWFTRYLITDGKGPLCRVKDKEMRCYGKEDGIAATYGLGLAKDTAGNIWFASATLWRWSPESVGVFFAEELKGSSGEGVIDATLGPSGTMWAAIDGTGPNLGVRYYSDGKWLSYAVPGFDGATVRADVLYLDRHNSMWVGTQSQGVYRLHDGVADHFGTENGLSGRKIDSIYEDREGNLWVVTENGVDMFRDMPVVNFSTTEGLSGKGVNSIIALRDNSIWTGSEGAVNILRPDGGSAITTLKGLPGKSALAMLEDRRGRIWLGVDDKLMIYEDGRFLEIKKSDGSLLRQIEQTRAAAEDSDGNVWALILKDGKIHLLRIRDEHVQEDIPVNSDSTFRPSYLAADREGSVWIGSNKDKLARYRNGQFEIVSLGDQATVTIQSLLVDSDNALWIATSLGLYRRTDDGLSLLDARNGLPCSPVSAVIVDDNGNFWLYARCSLLRIPAADMANWRKLPESKVSVKSFDALDGALPNPIGIRQSRVAKSKDGRLWFMSGSTVQMIDPRRDYTNPIPPPVHIEELIADRKSYPARGELSLPPLRGELEINYTGLSFTIPRKVKFRYKLEGHDTDWQDVGARRQAFYNSLAPGRYRFRVIAGNNDGIWNEAGATLDFMIQPMWYQTNAFRLLCVILVGLTAWALYQLRIRQISRVISARFDERLAERTRLARELHDTFLQTIQGSKMVADDALEQSGDPIRLRQAMEQLSGWLGQATEEGRAALNSLRTSTTEKNDLAAALRRATESCRLKDSATAEFSVVGESRDMHPIVRDEVYRIGYEAISNACLHSGATRLDVELRYAHNLCMRVSDNGRGIDPEVIEQGRPGHYGLQGMRERAARIGADLTIDSSADSGTEVTLVVPGGIVFRKAGAPPLDV